jgi:hypothetical protein
MFFSYPQSVLIPDFLSPGDKEPSLPLTREKQMRESEIRRRNLMRGVVGLVGGKG